MIESVRPGPGGARPGAGRKAEVTGLRKVQVYLDPASIDTAKKLGDGNVSAGVREALRSAADSVQEDQVPYVGSK